MSLSLTCSDDGIKNDVLNFDDMVYNYDWSSTLLGPMDSWEPALKNATTLCLKSAFPTCIHLGPPDWLLLYNKAFIPLLKSKHPCALGKPTKEVWPEAFDRMLPQFEYVKTTGKGIYRKKQYLELLRDGYTEESYFDYTFSPILKSDGTFCAIITLSHETTQRILHARRLKVLSEFGHRNSEVESLESACRLMTKVLSDNVDIPYALIYFVKHTLNTSSESLIARLIATTFDKDGKKGKHIPDYLPDIPEIIYLAEDSIQSYNTYIELKREAATYSFLKCESWPIHLVIKEGKHIKVLLKDDSQAVLLSTKISLHGDQFLSAILICGINQLRTLDEQYMEFLQLITNQMNIYLLHGKTIEEEKKRSKLLADLNYQKVAFFQGISHELKAPLTLMLSPLDSVIKVCPRETSISSYLQTIRRSAHRLLKLINNLLQFSNIEANQLEKKFRETNIAEFTRELASDFKNMAKTLGLDYIIDIPHSDEFIQTLDDKIYLDHDMYETIIYNLCSNAIKHTWNGCITIRLYIDYKDNKRMAVLEVSDTGVGIPETALPNIFQRFYRVESQGSRSHEGTGIGLALVKEFVACHGGNITVNSIVNRGTTFRCWFPIGCEHLPTNQIYIDNVENSIDSSRKLYINRQLYLEESSQWIKNNASETQHEILNQVSINSRNMNDDVNKILEKVDVNEKYHVLIVDDNNNMRDYLSELLREFIIYRACDGQHALQVLKKLKKLPDLILSDVMMPNMNGYELLDALRTNVKTQLIPVILLSAKVGEDSKIKGLDKGADDYLLKPFSARELIIRIRTNIKLSIFRRKILFQQYKQEATKQLLLSISSKIFSKSNLDETLQYIVKEIYHILPCERIFIISNERSDSKNNKIVVSYEDSKSITPITNPFMEMYDDNKNESQTFIKSQEYNNSGINICMNIYCDYIHKNVSVLSVELWLNNDFWGWIKVHRSPNSIWFDSEIELLQQISNQISLAITCAKLSEENTEKEIQIKAAEVANTAKSQILANTSHELRTPLGAIVGILTSFEGAPLTADQKSMINIMGHASDIVLSIINDILDAAKLEAQKITLINRTFDLLELFENIIENFGKKAGDKKVELIVNYDDQLPIYVKSDPDRLKRVLTHLLSNSVKFTDKGEILVKISMQSHETDENGENQTYSKIGKKGKLLIELYDTGIGMDPKYVQHAWKSFSQGDMSMTKKQDGTGLGLSICKSLVEINGGEINVESQLGKGSKFWFTWNFEFLSSLLDKQFDDQMCCTIRQKRILIIHPVENVRITMLKYLKRIKKVDAFDTFDKAIREAKKYKELFNIFAYDIAFISLYENNEDEVLKAALNLRKLEMNHNNLIIVFIVFPNEEGIKLAKNIVTKVGGATSILYTPITLKKLTNQFIFMEKNESINNNNKSQYINNNENIIKQVTDYNLKTENATQENTYECNPNDSEIKTTNVTNNKFIISVDDGYIENTLISKFQNLAIKQSLQK